MTVSQRLREAARPIWDRCLSHPFVLGLGGGTLPVEKFQYFMLQDYLYLFDYARVFALGVVKARDGALMRVFARNVEAILDGEMEIHRTYMARLGIAEEEVLAVRPALDNLSYTHYMLSAAGRGGPAEITASILACSWSYAEIGQTLAKIPGAADITARKASKIGGPPLLRRVDSGLRLGGLCRSQSGADRFDGPLGGKGIRRADGGS